jgi:hypothetical protein
MTKKKEIINNLPFKIVFIITQGVETFLQEMTLCERGSERLRRLQQQVESSTSQSLIYSLRTTKKRRVNHV